MDTPSTDPGSATGSPLSDDWCDHHFDYLAPELALNLHETLATMRERCPVAHSDQHEGYWIVTGYDDVLRVAQDWQTFSSAHGVSVPAKPSSLVAIPEHVDPPLHRSYKRLINPFFTAAAVAPYEQPTRELVTRLIDDFIERGSCDFMADFATPVPRPRLLRPGAERTGRPARASSTRRRRRCPSPPTRHAREAAAWMFQWISEFVATAAVGAAPRRRRRRHPRRRHRGPAHHRRRDRRDDPAPHPGRARDDGGCARPDHDPLHPRARDPRPPPPPTRPPPRRGRGAAAPRTTVHRDRSHRHVRHRGRRPADQARARRS